jgi:hypothetical protein
MESTIPQNRDHISKQQVMKTIVSYLGNVPFDVERLALVIQDIIHDPHVDIYMDDILLDYEQGEIINEVEVWSFLFDHASAVFEDIVAAYYDDAYIDELRSLAIQECNVSMEIENVLREDTSKLHDAKSRYVAQIKESFSKYDSSPARQSLIAGAQKVLVGELIKNTEKYNEEVVI